MILVSYIHQIVLGVLVGIFFLIPSFSFAQTSQILSVTPPLFQLSMLPGDVWQSTIKVVNGNNYPISVYAEVVNFQATGERGQGKFIPIISGEENQENTTLAEWIEINRGPFQILPEQAREIPFFVVLPDDAPPGGHYAAVLITTQAPDGGSMAVVTSQSVTSLFFVRVEGDVQESGSIREFRTLKSFAEIPKAEFSLRFENKGNVHLQPRGNIVITNMWGTERGVIPVNYQTNFGNVLPKSIRDYRFSWESDFNISDIGRYKAEVTLVYGDREVRNEFAVAYFWVIPLKGTLITLSVLALFIVLITWMVKAYVRRMLTLAGVDINQVKKENDSQKISEIHKKLYYRDVSAPIKDGVLDLRKQLSGAEDGTSKMSTIIHFVKEYKKFFISVGILTCIGVTLTVYIRLATEEHTRYNITIEEVADSAVVPVAE